MSDKIETITTTKSLDERVLEFNKDSPYKTYIIYKNNEVKELNVKEDRRHGISKIDADVIPRDLRDDINVKDRIKRCVDIIVGGYHVDYKELTHKTRIYKISSIKSETSMEFLLTKPETWVKFNPSNPETPTTIVPLKTGAQYKNVIYSEIISNREKIIEISYYDSGRVHPEAISQYQPGMMYQNMGKLSKIDHVKMDGPLYRFTMDGILFEKWCYRNYKLNGRRYTFFPDQISPWKTEDRVCKYKEVDYCDDGKSGLEMRVFTGHIEEWYYENNKLHGISRLHYPNKIIKYYYINGDQVPSKLLLDYYKSLIISITTILGSGLIPLSIIIGEYVIGGMRKDY